MEGNLGKRTILGGFKENLPSGITLDGRLWGGTGSFVYTVPRDYLGRMSMLVWVLAGIAPRTSLEPPQAAQVGSS